MRLALKIAGGAIALLVLALVTLVVVVATLDVETLIGPAKKRVKDLTGRDLAIGGVKVSLTPVPTVVLTDVAIANAPWGTAPQHASVTEAAAQLALTPLLH